MLQGLGHGITGLDVDLLQFPRSKIVAAKIAEGGVLVQGRGHDTGGSVGTMASASGSEVGVCGPVWSLARGEPEGVGRFVNRGLERCIGQVETGARIRAQFAEAHCHCGGLADLNSTKKLLRSVADGDVDPCANRRT